MKRSKLSSEEVQNELSKVSGWTPRDLKLYRKFEFRDFKEAFEFMTKVAAEAEVLDHHPDWKNVYNRVEVELNTHDLGGISSLDFALAAKMDQIFKAQTA